jgi:hypothetical protein
MAGIEGYRITQAWYVGLSLHPTWQRCACVGGAAELAFAIRALGVAQHIVDEAGEVLLDVGGLCVLPGETMMIRVSLT